MKWNKYSIKTTEEAEDLVCGMLAELGYESVEIEDKRPVTAEESGGLFGEVVPELPENDHVAVVSFYTEENADREKVLTELREGLAELASYVDVGEGAVTESSTQEEDWINNWKEYFHRFYVDDILIEPTWEADGAAEETAAMVLRIDPGTAFGTGAHESTQLAIRAIRRYVKPGDVMLDVGTGSGILGIVALKSGASHVFGTDLDPNTLPAIEDNLRQNGIEDADFERVLGDIASDGAVQEAAGFARYDLAVANIIAEILAGITPKIPRHLKKGGLYITSGILTEKEEIIIRAAEAAGMTVKSVERMGEWSGIVFQN